MRELEPQYEGKVKFNIVPNEAENFNADVEKYKLETHGLVAFDKDGNEVHSIPGHDFGKDELIAAIEKVSS